MTALVLGANGSGKSAYAEKIAVQTAEHESGVLYYVATMVPYGADGLKRVAKHRKQRRNKGFITVECPSNVSGIIFPKKAVVLLEDVSNLLSNAIFGNGGGDVYGDIAEMCSKCRTAVIVSIEGLTVESGYDAETREYIDSLNRLNERLTEFADITIKMRNGEPVFLTGDLYGLD